MGDSRLAQRFVAWLLRCCNWIPLLVKMQKTKVINATGTKIIVKMSNNGIITKLLNGEVESGGSYTISIDPNATYREYWCAVPPGTNPQKKTILSSDDCAEFREVKVMKDDTVNPPEYYWRGTKFRNSKSVASSVEEREAQLGSPSTVATTAPGSPSANDPKSKCLIL